MQTEFSFILIKNKYMDVGLLGGADVQVNFEEGSQIQL